MIHYLSYCSRFLLSFYIIYYSIQKEFISTSSSLVGRLQFEREKLYKNADLNKVKVTTSWPKLTTLRNGL